MTLYQLVEASEADDVRAYQPYGGAAAFWKCKDHEMMLSGPAETGKTRCALERLDALAWKYPGARLAMVRQTYKSTVSSVVQTYEKKVLGAWDFERGEFLPDKTPVKKHGGEKPEFYQYPNGSRIVVGGLDNPDKFLSSEYDIIYINQAEEILLDAWETLATRATGRAGNMPYAQMVGDCNPGPPTHWILKRRNDKKLRFFESRHEDNPTLFDPVTGAITEQGKRSLAVLDALTGVRKQRLRFGKWVQAEGVVYEGWDRNLHLIQSFKIPTAWTKIRSVDFGYTNPFVCQWWAIDPDDRLYLYRQIYMTKRTVNAHGEQINALSKWERYEATVADHDAEDRATLEEKKIRTKPADKRISVGIEKVAERLKVAGDGNPRLFVLDDSLVEVDPSLEAEHLPTRTEDEFEVYEWPKQPNGRSVREVPVDLHNHGMDAMRYAVMYCEKRRRLSGVRIETLEKTSDWL